MKIKKSLLKTAFQNWLVHEYQLDDWRQLKPEEIDVLAEYHWQQFWAEVKELKRGV
jgi:hypothetical protein